jgi:penicillin-binding protein 2
MYPMGGSDDRRSVTMRLLVVRYVLVAAFVALAASFWSLQVAQHARYRELAENNHLRTLPLRAPRGVLFDRDGRVLVENRYSFNISLVREQTKNLDQSIRLLASVLRIDERALRAVVDRHRREPSYRPIVVVQDATLAQVAAVAARRLELPDVVIEEVPARHYPTDELAAHLVGYVGEVTRQQLEQDNFRGLKSGAIVGQAGVEQAYNALLMGRDGERRVIVNSVGREIETVGEVEPVEGRRLQLTIDADLQRAAETAFRALGYNGAAVVLDPRTGEVLALVSLPAYDPNAFAVGIDRATWGALNADRLRPLQNRALQGRYSPGSVFKIVMAVAALEEGLITPDFKVTCRGAATFYGRQFLCHKKGGHGTVDLYRAIEQSCNVYFYTLGSLLKIDTIHKWATALGLGVLTGIDLPHELAGLVPSSTWKLARTGERWYPGETISVAIGQGPVWVTPLSLAVMIATVATGGTRPTPHVLKAVDQGAGWEPVPPPPPQSVVALKPQTVEAIRRGLWLVVNGAGTGGRARIAGRDVAGKTGTAQVVSIQGGKRAAGRTERDLRDHGWFVFFAPAGNPEIAGVVFAEHAEHGYLAAPIARHVLDTYFAKKEGRPLPQWPQPTPATAVAAAGGALP